MHRPVPQRLRERFCRERQRGLRRMSADDRNAGSELSLQELAGQILDQRERRKWFFPQAVLGETAWDMLLLLYASETRSLSFKTLCNALLVTPRIGGRWIDILQDEGLVTRSDAVRDKSCSSVTLTLKGLHALELYLSDRLQQSDDAHDQTKQRMAVGIAPMLLLTALAAVAGFLVCSSLAQVGA